MSEHPALFARALALSDAFPGFHRDSLDGELLRFRFKRALRRYAPWSSSELREKAIDRCAAFEHARSPQ